MQSSGCRKFGPVPSSVMVGKSLVVNRGLPVFPFKKRQRHSTRPRRVSKEGQILYDGATTCDTQSHDLVFPYSRPNPARLSALESRIARRTDATGDLFRVSPVPCILRYRSLSQVVSSAC